MTKPVDEKLMSQVGEMVEEILDQLELDLPSNNGLTSSTKATRQLAASYQATRCVQGRKVSTLNENELKSVYALLAYVSHNENTRQETVQAIVEANFGVNHISRLQQKDYEEVIRFLVDLRIDEMRN